MTTLICPKCDHSFEVEDYDSGNCPNCNKMYFHWDDCYDDDTGETTWEGFYWEPIN